MGGNRQPDYDFIAPRPGSTQDQPPAQAPDRHLPPIPAAPDVPEQGAPGAYAAPDGAPYAQAQAPYAQAPYAQTPQPPQPQPPYPPAAYPPGAYGQAHHPQGRVVPHPYLEPRRSGLPRWAIALIVTPIVLVVAGVGVAVAVPMFQNRQAKAEFAQTTVTLPAMITGLERQETDPSMESQLSGMGLPSGSLGVYGTDDDTMVVIAVKNDEAMVPSDQAKAREEMVKGFSRSSKMRLDLQSGDPGRLGGYLGCAQPAAPGSGSGAGAGTATVCLATDSAALVMMVKATPVTDPAALMQKVRAATVHRA
ncbi:hypothetical protein ACIB24_07955 [Spongisporangium articulatum]|uniref:Uncharacterized protein n=1 Tax=Spongisporangium articulatum TaxID=3362603 RepID=A0ABW8AKU1_9ACTN